MSPPATAPDPGHGDSAERSPARKAKPAAVKDEAPRTEPRAAPEEAGAPTRYPLPLLRSHLLHHLRPGSAPEAMAGREREHAVLSAFLRDRVAQRCAGSLYLCGSPGTGKTASVHFILRSLIQCGALDPEVRPHAAVSRSAPPACSLSGPTAARLRGSTWRSSMQRPSPTLAPSSATSGAPWSRARTSALPCRRQPPKPS